MFPRSRLVIPAVAAFLTLFASASQAGEPRTHDGFLLRLSAGGGGARTSIETPVGDLDFSGPSGDVNFAVGGAVAPNFIVHGTLWGWAVADPDVELGGASATINDATLSMSAWGVGFTYYVMPVNLYFSPSVGVAKLTVEEDGVSVDSDPGVAFDLTVGKEWWVGDNWGLGVAGAFSYHKIPAGDDPTNSGFGDDFKGPSGAIRFTATMN